MEIPVKEEILSRAKKDAHIKSLEDASIRQIKKMGDVIESLVDLKEGDGEGILRMEMGIPGLRPVEYGILGQVSGLLGAFKGDLDYLKEFREKKISDVINLDKSVAKTYPDIYGIGDLKSEMSRFLKLFLNIDIPPEHCFPTVGSMMGAFVTILTLSKLWEKRNKVLFIDPGFPVQKQQCQVLGIPYEGFDIYDFRGEKLKTKLEEYLKRDEFSTIIYSSPNNPTWVAFTEEELKIIGEMATKYDVIVVEDLAYFGMDFRKDYSQPGREPYQPTVSRYTDNFILLISSSKVFSYAGERIAMVAVSDGVWERKSEGLKKSFSFEKFGEALIYGVLYAVSSGVSHSAQLGLLTLLKSVNDGMYNFVEGVREYGERAKVMKEIFQRYGFEIVYDRDGDEEIADGFYFTLSYPHLSTEKLLYELIRHGISAISLKITGSRRDGIRACTALIGLDKMGILQNRLEVFQKNNPTSL